MDKPSSISTEKAAFSSALPIRSPLHSAIALPQSPRSINPNPLTAKITAILSTTFADAEVRDALETLDSRDVKNTPETRRQLRLDVEKEIIQSNAEVIDDFGIVCKQLKTVGTALAQLQANCAALRTHINNARVEAAPMLEEANTLLARQQEVQNKQKLLSSFVSHFQLNADEIATLTSPATPVSDDFFTALSKAKTIHQDSQLLLSSANQRLGLEILDSITKTLNSAFQKLSRWLQREFRALEVLENPRLTFAIRRALRALAKRPTLFQSCLDAFAEAREQSLEDSLFKALTGDVAGDEANLKPIEFSAHEPLRYVGDMLAWAHSTTVSEREALEVLFVSEGDDIAKGIKEGLEIEPWSRPEDGETFDPRKALGQLVNRNLAGVTRLLRQRIDQVIKTHEEPVLQYKIANLIVFYRNIFEKLLEREGSLIEMLLDIENEAISQFRVAMKYHTMNVQGENATVPDDLSPPDFLSDALEELRSLLKSYDTSIVNTDAGGSGLSLLFEEALDPFLENCDKLSEPLRSLHGNIFAINCILACRSTLLNFSFTSDKIKELDASKDRHAENLIESQHGFFLLASGLRSISSRFESLPQDPEKWVQANLFAPDSLYAASRKLDQFLPSALTDALENLKRLQNGSLAHDITNEAASKFCDDFQNIENAIIQLDESGASQVEAGVEHKERVSPLKEVFPRTTEEIKILLS